MNQVPMETAAYLTNDSKVTVKFTIGPAEPNVGIMGPYIDDWWITEIDNKPVESRRIDWFYNLLSDEDEDIIIEACFEALEHPEY